MSRLLWMAPPALRVALVRHGLLGTERTHGATSAIPDRRLLHVLRVAHAQHIPRRKPFISCSQGSQRRSDSTSTVNPSSTSTSPTTTTSSQQAEAPPKSRTRRFFTASALVLVFFTAGITMAAAPAAETMNGYINPASDAETLRLYHPRTPSEQEADEYILNHPLSRKLRAQEGMYESRPHMRIPPAMREFNLTAGTLMGENKIAAPPLNFNDKHAELPTMTQIMYLGPALCGHPGIVHGGLLATLLDEGLARACFPALPHKVGVTASLKIDYRVPCPAGKYVVLKAQTTKVEGRKVWATGWIELLGEEDGTGQKLVEAEALYIEPKNAKNMARNIVASD